MNVCSEVVDSLSTICEVREDDLRTDQVVKILVFDVGHARTTIRIIFNDRQSGADLLITNITTLPETAQHHGFGSKALQKLIRWAKAADLTNIQATQVLPWTRRFWLRNGFWNLWNETNDYFYRDCP